MANATGEVVEAPTQDLPFKAVIFTEGKIIQERFFASRPEAEAFLVETLRGIEEDRRTEGRPAPVGGKSQGRGRGNPHSGDAVQGGHIVRREDGSGAVLRVPLRSGGVCGRNAEGIEENRQPR